MENTIKTPVELLTDLLSNMTQRAIQAEAERDAEKKRADEWYQYYRSKEAELDEVVAELAAEVKENANLRATVNALNREHSKPEE